MQFGHTSGKALGVPRTSKRAQTIDNISKSLWKDGYNSDGNIGPFSDAVLGMEDDDIEAEDAELPASMLEGGGKDDSLLPQEDENGVPTWYLTNEEIKAMRVDTLKAAIESRGLKPKGKKADLVQMLRDCVAQKIPISEQPVANVEEFLGFPVGTRWKLLSPSSTPSQDPVNEFNFRAPTDDPDHPMSLPKMNYDERWDQPVFTG